MSETVTPYQNSRRFVQSEQQQRIEKFMRDASQAVQLHPIEPTLNERILRAKLILESALETCAALGITIHGTCLHGIADIEFQGNSSFNMVESVDNCCNVLIAAIGTLSSLGVGDTHVMNAVLDANDAKLAKPENWQPPDIAGELRRQGWEG